MSFASNLVSGDTNNAYDVFVYDRVNHITERISVASDGAQANGPSPPQVSMSADGRYVAFWSEASNLVPNDTNGTTSSWAGRDVFVHDRITHSTQRVSVASDGTQANNESEYVSISADGRFVSFASVASNLIPDDTNHTQDVYVYDRVTRTVERVSIGNDGAQSYLAGGNQSVLSADGRLVAFVSHSTNLIEEDNNGVAPDILLRDRLTHTTTRISVTSDGTQGNGSQSYNSFAPSISADGHYVVFVSDASNLVQSRSG